VEKVTFFDDCFFLNSTRLGCQVMGKDVKNDVMLIGGREMNEADYCQLNERLCFDTLARITQDGNVTFYKTSWLA